MLRRKDNHGGSKSGFMVTCGWCGTHYAQWISRCESCGGALPLPPGMELGPEPPPMPRELPPGVETRMKWGHNVLTMVGGIFFLVGSILTLVFLLVLPIGLPLPLIFVVVGWFIFRAGRREANRIIQAFREGLAIKGTISDVHLDASLQINGQHPYRISYQFEAGGLSYDGYARTFDYSAAQRQPGQPIWVLYLRDDPSVNTVYPPVK